MLELIFSFLIMVVSYTLLLTATKNIWKPIQLSLVFVSITSMINCLSNIRLYSLGHTFLQNYDDFSHLAFIISVFVLLTSILVKRFFYPFRGKNTNEPLIS